MLGQRLRSFPLGVAFATLALFCACGGGVDVRQQGTRAVVIGIDGADWKIIDALAAEGELPNLTGLRERGVSGPIETLHEMPLSPVIWTSVATGKRATEHGISWFMVDRPDGTRVPVRSHNRKVKAIWNILGENRRRASVVGWWATYPAEEIGKGAIVSDGLGFHGFGATARGGDDTRKTYPESLFPRANALVPTVQQIGAEYASRYLHFTPEQYAELMYTPAKGGSLDAFNPVHLFQQYTATAEGYTAIAEELLESRSYDLFMVYFEQVDSFSHLFIKFAPPRLEWVDEVRYERFRDVVSEWYRHQDELLGRLLAKIDLEETAVFVLSDHGFKSGERRIRSEEVVDVNKAHLDHETHGIFIAAGPHLRHGAEIAGASVLDITPTLLHYLGFPVAKDMVGRVLDQTFEPDFLTEHPVRYIDTYEDGVERRQEVDDGEVDPDVTQHQLEALRALGYVGDDGPEGEGAATTDGAESSPELHANMGRMLLAQGEALKARAEFEKALELDPNYAQALLDLGGIHRAEGKIAQAEHLTQRALQVNPNSIGALAQLAEIKRDQGELDEAIRLFGEALTIDDSSPGVFLGFGDVLQRAGRFAEAEEAFRSALGLDPDSFKAYYNLGVTYGNQGLVAQAIESYEKSLELAPNYPEASQTHNNLGAIYLAQGETQQAEEQFEHATRISPYNLESRYNLALIYSSSGRIEEAVPLLEQAAALQPNHEVVSVALGFAYLQVGRGEGAYKSFLLVRRLYPSNWEADLGMAVLHAQAEQMEPARRFLSDAYVKGGQAARDRAAGYPILAAL